MLKTTLLTLLEEAIGPLYMSGAYRKRTSAKTKLTDHLNEEASEETLHVILHFLLKNIGNFIDFNSLEEREITNAFFETFFIKLQEICPQNILIDNLRAEAMFSPKEKNQQLLSLFKPDNKEQFWALIFQKIEDRYIFGSTPFYQAEENIQKIFQLRKNEEFQFFENTKIFEQFIERLITKWPTIENVYKSYILKLAFNLKFENSAIKIDFPPHCLYGLGPYEVTNFLEKRYINGMQAIDIMLNSSKKLESYQKINFFTSNTLQHFFDTVPYETISEISEALFTYVEQTFKEDGQSQADSKIAIFTSFTKFLFTNSELLTNPAVLLSLDWFVRALEPLVAVASPENASAYESTISSLIEKVDTFNQFYQMSKFELQLKQTQYSSIKEIILDKDFTSNLFQSYPGIKEPKPENLSKLNNFIESFIIACLRKKIDIDVCYLSDWLLKEFPFFQDDIPHSLLNIFQQYPDLQTQLETHPWANLYFPKDAGTKQIILQDIFSDRNQSPFEIIYLKQKLENPDLTLTEKACLKNYFQSWFEIAIMNYDANKYFQEDLFNTLAMFQRRIGPITLAKQDIQHLKSYSLLKKLYAHRCISRLDFISQAIQFNHLLNQEEKAEFCTFLTQRSTIVSLAKKNQLEEFFIAIDAFFQTLDKENPDEHKALEAKLDLITTSFKNVSWLAPGFVENLPTEILFSWIPNLWRLIQQCYTTDYHHDSPLKNQLKHFFNSISKIQEVKPFLHATKWRAIVQRYAERPEQSKSLTFCQFLKSIYNELPSIMQLDGSELAMDLKMLVEICQAKNINVSFDELLFALLSISDTNVYKNQIIKFLPNFSLQQSQTNELPSSFLYENGPEIKTEQMIDVKASDIPTVTQILNSPEQGAQALQSVQAQIESLLHNWKENKTIIKEFLNTLSKRQLLLSIKAPTNLCETISDEDLNFLITTAPQIACGIIEQILKQQPDTLSHVQQNIIKTCFNDQPFLSHYLCTNNIDTLVQNYNQWITFFETADFPESGLKNKLKINFLTEFSNQLSNLKNDPIPLDFIERYFPEIFNITDWYFSQYEHSPSKEEDYQKFSTIRANLIDVSQDYIKKAHFDKWEYFIKQYQNSNSESFAMFLNEHYGKMVEDRPALKLSLRYCRNDIQTMIERCNQHHLDLDIIEFTFFYRNAAHSQFHAREIEAVIKENPELSEAIRTHPWGGAYYEEGHISQVNEPMVAGPLAQNESTVALKKILEQLVENQIDLKYQNGMMFSVTIDGKKETNISLLFTTADLSQLTIETKLFQKIVNWWEKHPNKPSEEIENKNQGNLFLETTLNLIKLTQQLGMGGYKITYDTENRIFLEIPGEERKDITNFLITADLSKLDISILDPELQDKIKEINVKSLSSFKKTDIPKLLQSTLKFYTSSTGVNFNSSTINPLLSGRPPNTNEKPDQQFVVTILTAAALRDIQQNPYNQKQFMARTQNHKPQEGITQHQGHGSFTRAKKNIVIGKNADPIVILSNNALPAIDKTSYYPNEKEHLLPSGSQVRLRKIHKKLNIYYQEIVNTPQLHSTENLYLKLGYMWLQTKDSKKNNQVVFYLETLLSFLKTHVSADFIGEAASFTNEDFDLVKFALLFANQISNPDTQKQIFSAFCDEADREIIGNLGYPKFEDTFSLFQREEINRIIQCANDPDFYESKRITDREKLIALLVHMGSMFKNKQSVKKSQILKQFTNINDAQFINYWQQVGRKIASQPSNSDPLNGFLYFQKNNQELSQKIMYKQLQEPSILPISIDLEKDFEKTSSAKGTNPGGFYKEKSTGNEYYIKWLPVQYQKHATEAKSFSNRNINRIHSEYLAWKLYGLFGINTPAEMELIYCTDDKGEEQVGLKISKEENISSLQSIRARGQFSEKRKAFWQGFLVDALLANYDVVGLEYNNAHIDSRGNALRLDFGGALNYGAQGKPKKENFAPYAGEFEDMVLGTNSNTGYNQNVLKKSKDVFDGIYQSPELLSGLQVLLSVDEDDLIQCVEQYGFTNPAKNARLIEKLLARKNDLIKKTETKLFNKLVQDYLHTKPSESDTTYRQFSQEEPLLYRVKHGGMHASRVALHTEKFVRLLQDAGYEPVQNFNEKDLFLLKVAAMFHDAGREKDQGNDKKEWEIAGAEKCKSWLQQGGFSEQEIEQVYRAISHKDDPQEQEKNPYTLILAAADSLDWVRSHSSNFNIKFMPKIIKEQLSQEQLLQLATEAKKISTAQGDSPRAQLNMPGDFNIEKKKAIEFSDMGCFAAILETYTNPNSNKIEDLFVHQQEIKRQQKRALEEKINGLNNDIDQGRWEDALTKTNEMATQNQDALIEFFTNRVSRQNYNAETLHHIDGFKTFLIHFLKNYKAQKDKLSPLIEAPFVKDLLLNQSHPLTQEQFLDLFDAVDSISQENGYDFKGTFRNHPEKAKNFTKLIFKHRPDKFLENACSIFQDPREMIQTILGNKMTSQNPRLVENIFQKKLLSMFRLKDMEELFACLQCLKHQKTRVLDEKIIEAIFSHTSPHSSSHSPEFNSLLKKLFNPSNYSNPDEKHRMLDEFVEYVRNDGKVSSLDVSNPGSSSSESQEVKVPIIERRPILEEGPKDKSPENNNKREDDLIKFVKEYLNKTDFNKETNNELNYPYRSFPTLFHDYRKPLPKAIMNVLDTIQNHHQEPILSEALLKMTREFLQTSKKIPPNTKNFYKTLNIFLEKQLDANFDVDNFKNLKQHYQYATFFKNKRFHAYTLRAEEFERFDKYAGLTGDALKTRILKDFKEKLENYEDPDDFDKYCSDYKQSKEYEALKKGQGLWTRFWRIQTSSQKAVEKIIDEVREKKFNESQNRPLISSNDVSNKK